MKRDEFIEKCCKTIAQAISFAEKARREGLLALEDVLEDIETDENRGILKYGLRLVVDGTEKEFIDKVLTNIIEHEKDDYARRLKIIKKEAVLMILEGMNTRLIAIMLLSYLDDETVSLVEKYILGDSSDKKDDDLDLDA